MPPEIGIDGKRRCAKHDKAARLFIMAAAGALLTGNAAFSRQIVLPEHKSIHQIESEAHCDFVPRSVKTGRRMLSLSPSQPPNRTRTVFGFYPYWAPGFSELRFRDLTHLAVFSAEASGSGQLVNLRGWPNGPLIQAAHDANVRIVIVCTLFSASQLDLLLSSPGAQQALISNFKEQVLAGGADGVNIDFEGVPGQQRANLVLLNTTTAPQAFLMRGYVTGRAEPIVASWVLKPGQQMADVVSEETVLGAAIFGREGWLEITCEDQNLRSMYALGDSHVARSLDGGPLPGSSGRQILPHVDDGRARIDIVNPNDAFANLAIQLFTAGGPYRLALSLPARSLYTEWVADMFPSAFPQPARAADGNPTQSDFVLVQADQPRDSKNKLPTVFDHR